METTTTAKSRTTSRCREWERQRRLKFNDAISKLGEVVKAINKANSSVTGESEDNAQYAKIEIVQKAIICLTNCAQEKTQLKAEILALEVKLQGIEKQKLNKRDVSLQVAIGVNKRNQRSKYVKLLMLQKEKQSNSKEKIIKPSPKPKIEKKLQPAAKLPKLLPISNIKKENTYVMLPAAPYIFPQRSVIFPTVQPTIVLVDANVQTINKPATIPIINRCANDITRTTMVNVLPISAYSRPLSASKTKKNNIKSKSASKKTAKKSKLDEKKSEDIHKTEPSTDTATEINHVLPDQTVSTEKESLTQSTKSTESIKLDKENKKEKETCSQNNRTEEKNVTSLDKNDNDSKNKNKESSIKCDSEKIANTIDKQRICKKSIDSVKENELTLQVQNIPEGVEKPSDPVTNLINDKCNKIVSEKTTLCDIRNKEKLQGILDPAICESVVDTGNARLELAEEFLAASPTAAFLMSFPLVSGNRADSPAEEPHQSTVPNITKESNHQNENTTRAVPFFEKSHSPVAKAKTNIKIQTATNNSNKNHEQQKYQDTKQQPLPKSTVSSTPNVCNENPFLNLPIPTVATSNCTLPDTSSFSLDFDCNLSKTLATQPTTSFSNSNNIFYKSDTLSTAKNTIYSTSNISSGHEFNSLGLYPCAVDNYTNKNKTDYHNADDNLMKINSSRLTYDIDLGWSHKGFDFVNCTTSSSNLHKDNILTTAPTSYSTSYNPFNPDFHVPLVPNSNKKSISSSKLSTFPETITSFYSQNSTLWPEDIPNMYSHSNVSKNFTMKQQNYLPLDNIQPTLNQKSNTTKHYEHKQISDTVPENILKTPAILGQQIPEKFTKKSPSKMHINWMTSEVRPMQNDCNQPPVEIKETFKLPYTQQDQSKKQAPTDTNYFPINMHHFSSQPNHDESHVWPTPRPAGTTEVTIEPPPINLPTLVGDLALGPHDRKKNDLLNRGLPHSDLQICNNFFSVTQLMNRSSDNVSSRHNGPIIEASKSTNVQKHNSVHTINDVNRKGMSTRLENQPQLPYIFNETKTGNTFDNMPQFSHSKSKSSKADKNPKNQKINYSAEALIRGGTCSQKHQDSKYLVAAQKYNEYNIAHDTGVAQVSHFPPIIDYTDNNFAGQQFSGTTLYNTSSNSISNSFYSNFMPSGSNLMSSNYAGGHFTSDFVDYSNQTGECNYTNHKYDSKIRNNGPTYHQEKESSTYKSSRRETAAKHKLECSKKEGNAKKYQSKRAKINNETVVEEWNDPSHVLWQNKNTVKRHTNIMADESTFPNYVGNQMATQYQPEYFNSHLVSNTQNMGPNGERALSSFPIASSRANFNLSALFPEITTKVQ